MQFLALLLACVSSSGCCWVIVRLCIWSRFSAMVQHNQQKPTALTFVTPICSFLNFSRGLMSRSDAFWTCRGTVIKNQGWHSNRTANTLLCMCIKGIKVLGLWSSLQKGNSEVELRRSIPLMQTECVFTTERVNFWSCHSCVLFKCFWVNK